MKRVLVTGGSRGIGAAAVRLFAADGWQVIANYCGSEEQARALAAETGCLLCRADVSDSDGRSALLAFADEALGGIDVLVNNAGVALFGLFDALGVPDAARAKLLEKLREKNAHELRAAAGAAGGNDLLAVAGENILVMTDIPYCCLEIHNGGGGFSIVSTVRPLHLLNENHILVGLLGLTIGNRHGREIILEDRLVYLFGADEVITVFAKPGQFSTIGEGDCVLHFVTSFN